MTSPTYDEQKSTEPDWQFEDADAVDEAPEGAVNEDREHSQEWKEVGR